MAIEPELADVGEGIEVTLPPFVIPNDEFQRPSGRRDLQMLDKADELLRDGHPDSAVVVAQTATEVVAAGPADGSTNNGARYRS
jgi:hypothetical protein